MSILSYNEDETIEEIAINLDNIGKALQLLSKRLQEASYSYEEYSTIVKENIDDNCDM